MRLGDASGLGEERLDTIERAFAPALAAVEAAARANGDDVLLPLRLPATLSRTLAAAIALEEDHGGGHAEALRRHYLELMPAQRLRSLALDAPGARLLHSPLDWARLPRLSGAIDRLFAHLGAAGVTPDVGLGFASADALRGECRTVAALYARTYYGGCMPLLYGSPADLALAERELEQQPVDDVVDRRLAAPLVHELAHLAPGRRGLLPLYLDECVAAYLGVRVLPEFAYPAPGEDNGIYATPWLAQVGQALARALGVPRLVRAHAGVEPLPAALAEALLRRGWEAHRVRRPLHLLADSYDPGPWLTLIGAHDAGHGDPSPLDDEILDHGLRAMCLRPFRRDGAFRVATRPPPGPILVDAVAGRLELSPGAEGLDPVPPSYPLPAPVAAGLQARGMTRLLVTVRDVGAIASIARVLRAGTPGAGDNFVVERHAAARQEVSS